MTAELEFARIAVPFVPGKHVVIPQVTVASLAVYGVMGGLGLALSHFARSKGSAQAGGALAIAALVGSGYALSHAIVANVAPTFANGAKEP